MKEHWIWLATRSGIGPIRQRKLLEQFGSAEKLWSASPAELVREGLSPSVREALKDRSLGPAGRILEECKQAGIRVLTAGEPGFPAVLNHQTDAPVVLYARGTLPDPELSAWIAVVGSRDADRRGLAAARQLGWQIAGCGGVVVTGMARGIDAASAWGALEYGSPVIGVLGSGVDIVYPAENAALFDRVAKTGCLLSEYPPGTRPAARHFPARNRIISALSDGVTVVRASARSGALITARWAADQGRDVFAVPGPPDDPLSAGCNQLLRNGAFLVECGWDILSEYEYRYPGAVWEYHGRPPAEQARRSAPDSPRTVRAGAGSGPVRKAAASAPAPVPDGLTPLQQRIVGTLAEGPLQLDTLIARLDCSAAEILPQLTLLQIRKCVVCLPGKRYALADS